MIRAAKGWAKKRWPPIRLRLILLSVLLFAAALPGVGAVFLRVYENTLVRQTEAELIAQGAAIGAFTASRWPGASTEPASPPAVPVAASLSYDRRGLQTDYYRPEPLTIDLRSSRVLPERPRRRADAEPAPDAAAAAADVAASLRATSRTTLASIRLLDRAGVVAAGGPDRGIRLGDLPEVQAARAGRTLTLLRANAGYQPRYMGELLSRAAGIRVHHARPVIVDGKVVGVLLLSRSPRGLFVGIYQDRGKILLGIVLIFLVLLGLAGLLSRAIARPIEVLGQATREVAHGGGTVPDPPATAAIEIRALYADFAEMAAAIERRSRYLRDFAHAVSHEFKTPLAGIAGAIELLQDHQDTMSDADRQRFLANASADAQRLSLLVTRLLDLARADMARPGQDEAVALGPVLHRIADACTSATFAVHLAVDAHLPLAAIPEGAISAVLVSLVENSRQAGASEARIAATTLPRRLRIAVSDNGPGIPPGDRDRIFEPFFTSRRAGGGTGLGLPIARSLIQAARGEILLVDAEAGAAFEILVPQA
ncbi:sensor histidine kinase [Sphingomonas sanxanigenens]|uniref:histidine kinase n=1 Tax=Sphingomonas sanxanigenens DSM 19645 = NX02 TaxID=1123269 RepID=W0AG52_9SPHN|nr:HAMP domain-containing sensor histidine kinase [Sphingomonas sanxanigenens]AHE56894.1 hypothetical protein NX02_26510 [Sphingomonas sanxanigenens DSM 19645 = NX02]